MPLAHGVVVEVVGWRDLHAARAECRVDIVVRNDRNLAAHQGQANHLADEGLVAGVFRVHGHGLIAQHGLWSCGGHHQAAAAIGQRVAQLPEVPLLLLTHHLQIGDRGEQGRVPVHQAFAAVDEALLIELDEDGLHHGRAGRAHGEVLQGPVAARGEPAHLPGDGGARLLLPVPDLFQKALSAEVVARDALGIELTLHDDLCGDAGMVGARQPQGVVAAHAMPAGERVHQRLVEGMPHVQGAGHIGRRQLDAEGLGLGLLAGCIEATTLPLRPPVGFELGGFKGFIERRHVGDRGG